MTTKMIMIRDAAGNTTYAPPFSDVVGRTTLVQNVEQTMTIPVEFTIAQLIFSYSGDNLYVNLNDTATVPGAAVSFADTTDHNPTSRYVIASGSDVLHLLTDDTNGGKVTVLMFEASHLL